MIPVYIEPKFYALPTDWDDGRITDFQLFNLEGDRIEWLERQLTEHDRLSVIEQIEEGEAKRNEQSFAEHQISMRTAR